MKKMMSSLGVGMVMGASLMGAYMHFMPQIKKNNHKKKIVSPYTSSLTSVKDN